jgi:hypothetical protein
MPIQVATTEIATISTTRPPLISQLLYYDADVIMCFVDVCPDGRAQYLQNGLPRNCMNGLTCPNGYTCVYSTSAQGYYCCATVESRSGLTNTESEDYDNSENSIGGGDTAVGLSSSQMIIQSSGGDVGCPYGKPLMFPATKQPVTCTAFNRCPSGSVA